MNYNEKYTEYQVNRSGLRYFIRDFYLKNILRFAVGKCIDFGCGSGDLLRKLPEGSVGVDINVNSIEYCKKNGLNAFQYFINVDNYKLKCFVTDKFDTLICSHVLEHIDDAQQVIKMLFASTARLNIKRFIIVVPGIKGFKYDDTHKTYIDVKYIYKNNLDELDGYRLTYKKYFPVNSELFSKYFTHNELVLVYNKVIT